MKKQYHFLKSVFVITAICGLLSMPAFAEDLMIRGDINLSDGTAIHTSAPVCLLETLKAPLPAPIKINQEKLCALVDGLLGDIASMKGQDIVRVEGKDKVRFWVDGVDQDNPAEANFVKVSVRPAHDNQPRVDVCIPKGLFLLASFIGNVVMEQQGEQLFKMMGHNMPSMPHPPVPMHQPEKQQKEKPVKEKVEKKEHAPNPEQIKKEILKNLLKELKESLGEDNDD